MGQNEVKVFHLTIISVGDDNMFVNYLFQFTTTKTNQTSPRCSIKDSLKLSYFLKKVRNKEEEKKSIKPSLNWSEITSPKAFLNYGLSLY